MRGWAVSPRNRKRVLWALMSIALACAAIGVVSLVDYTVHGPRYNADPVEDPQEKEDLVRGLVLLGVAYKVAFAALVVSGTAYPVWPWLRARKRALLGGRGG